MWPQTLLMVNPEFFDVKYSINPHMQDAAGNLKTVDRPLALQQWNTLKNKFLSLGMSVEVINSAPEFPDMVFCANQMFPFIKNNQRQVILSHMASELRQGEVSYFKSWAQKNNIPYYELQGSTSFEAMGDLLWNYESQELFGGFGFRTDPHVYDQIEDIVGRKIHRLELINEHFYHMDTCFSILNKDSALYVDEAFSREGKNLIQKSFKNLITVPIDEAIDNFAGNACAINGTDVILQKGSTQTKAQLIAQGFKVHEVDTSEYIKAGGSVFCMKLLI